MVYLWKILAILAGLGLWHLTQRWIGMRKGTGEIYDWIHERTAGLNARLHRSPRTANFLLASSSLCIDLMGIYLLAASIFGPTLRPFLGILLLFSLRQLNQFVTALPPPKGVIWRNPGLPSLLVTYGVSEDLFFSGHTALAVFAAIELSHLGPWAAILGSALVLYEIAVVLVLRAHWTMDVFAGIVTALWVATLTPVLASWIDPFLR